MSDMVLIMNQDSTLIHCVSQFDNLILPELLACLTEIPGHNPERYEACDWIEDPSMANDSRASLVAKALECFQKSCMNGDLQTNCVDLICDLLHLAHAHG